MNRYRIKVTQSLDSLQKLTVFELWNNEYPLQLVHERITDFENYLSHLIATKHYLLYDENEAIIGWGIIFLRDSEQWFALLIDTRFQGMGLGTFLLNELKKTQPVLNGWVIDHENDLKQNGKPYLSPLAFYKKNNFEVLGNFRIENEKLSAVKIKWHSN